MTSSDHEVATFVEGIGDDVVEVCFACIVLLLAIAVYVYRYFQTAGTTIHVASTEIVTEVREHRNRQPRLSDNGETLTRHERRRNDLTCPVCLADAQFPVETNCGHLFCAQCMITYWETGRWIGAVRCPSCRQQVTILLPCFSEPEMNSTSEERNQILANINRYNRRFSGEPLSWMEYLYDLPTMLRHCLAEFFSLSGLLWMFRLRIVMCFLVAALYLISPLDIIPEAAFGFFGLLDDVFVTLLLAVYVSIIYRRLIAERAEAATATDGN